MHDGTEYGVNANTTVKDERAWVMWEYCTYVLAIARLRYALRRMPAFVLNVTLTSSLSSCYTPSPFVNHAPKAHSSSSHDLRLPMLWQWSVFLVGGASPCQATSCSKPLSPTSLACTSPTTDRTRLHHGAQSLLV